MRKINLGCGPYKFEGYINIDSNPNWNPDIVRDVTKGLPFDSNSVDNISAHHFLEHLTTEDMLFVLEECFRVLKPNAEISIIVPIQDYDIDHEQIFTEYSLDVLYRSGEMKKYYNKNMEWSLVHRKIEDSKKGEIPVHMIHYILRPVK